MIPPLQIGFWPPTLDEWNEPYIADNNSSYLPNKVDDLIQEWMKNDETIEDFVRHINREHHSFKMGNDEQKRLICLDLFYTALEMRLEQLPSAHKYNEDYFESIYVNPDFFHSELPKIFPFYKYQLDGTGRKIVRINLIDNKTLQPEAGYPLLGEEYDMKKSPDIYTKISTNFQKEIDSYKGARKPSKILKSGYPLYFFHL